QGQAGPRQGVQGPPARRGPEVPARPDQHGQPDAAEEGRLRSVCALLIDKTSDASQAHEVCLMGLFSYPSRFAPPSFLAHDWFADSCIPIASGKLWGGSPSASQGL